MKDTVLTPISHAVKESLVGRGMRVADVNRAARAVGGQQDRPGRGGNVQVGVVNHRQGLAGRGENIEAEGSRSPDRLGKNRRGSRGGACGRDHAELGAARQTGIGDGCAADRLRDVIKKKFARVIRASLQSAGGNRDGRGGAGQSAGLVKDRRLENENAILVDNYEINPVPASAAGERVPSQGEGLRRIDGLRGGIVAHLRRIRQRGAGQGHRLLLVWSAGNVETVTARRVGRIEGYKIGGGRSVCIKHLRLQVVLVQVQNHSSRGYRHLDAGRHAI